MKSSLNKHIQTYYNVEVTMEEYKTIRTLTENYMYESYMDRGALIVSSQNLDYILEDLEEEEFTHEDDLKEIELLKELRAVGKGDSIIHVMVEW